MKTIAVPADLFASILTQLHGLLDCQTTFELNAKRQDAAQAWRAGKMIALGGHLVPEEAKHSCPHADLQREVTFELAAGEYEIRTFGPSSACVMCVTPIRVEHPGVVIVTTGHDRTVDIKRLA